MRPPRHAEGPAAWSRAALYRRDTVVRIGAHAFAQQLFDPGLLDLTFSLPALAAGAALGVIMFRKVNDALFRSVVLVVLLFAGLFLVV